jgi:hypothetical protein
MTRTVDRKGHDFLVVQERANKDAGFSPSKSCHSDTRAQRDRRNPYHVTHAAPGLQLKSAAELGNLRALGLEYAFTFRLITP